MECPACHEDCHAIEIDQDFHRKYVCSCGAKFDWKRPALSLAPSVEATGAIGSGIGGPKDIILAPLPPRTPTMPPDIGSIGADSHVDWIVSRLGQIERTLAAVEPLRSEKKMLDRMLKAARRVVSPKKSNVIPIQKAAGE